MIARLKRLWRLWPFVGLDIWERPSEYIWANSVLAYIMADPVKRANFEACLWRAYDNWRAGGKVAA